MKSAEERTFSTPMMQQYMRIKEQHKDCLLFFRLGDFYEMFLEDALIGSKILDIVLTRRPRGKDGDIPMAGVPYHSVDNYIARLVKAGYKVAICEQTSEPDNKGIVEREVIRIITPGTMMDENSLVKNKSNYIMSLKYDPLHLGIALLDLSTGSFQVTQVSHSGNYNLPLVEEIRRFLPSECILSSSQYADYTLLKTISGAASVNIYEFNQWDEISQSYEQYLKEHFHVDSLIGFGIENWELAQQAASALLGYVRHTQKTTISHVTHIESYHPDVYVKLDESTIRNLELFETIREKDLDGTFLFTVDKTKTAVGGRWLKDWIRKPLMDIGKITDRQDVIQVFVQNPQLGTAISDVLANMRDIERMFSRLSLNLGNARDLNNLKETLKQIIEIKNLIPTNTPLLKEIHTKIDIHALQKIVTTIELQIIEDPPITITEGGMFRPGINQELDNLKDLLHKGSKWIKELERKEKNDTHIPTLKVRFNKVFGFYIEISKPHVDKVPDYYIRKQTMINTERYITEELKLHEKEVLSAEERIQKLEQRLFHRLLDNILQYTKEVQNSASAIAQIDCLLAFSQQALSNNYSRPKFVSGNILKITQGRHPVVEEAVARGEFVSNDTLLNNTDHQLIILTGPNMAGKSVYIRQVALITLMAHIGMYVPAEYLELSLVDRIFVRSGASDVISSGLSTFMVEMVETANILNHATPQSLVIMDEVGRGTSTYDGISIASSVVEYLVTQQQKRTKTLFATHYHEIQELEDLYPKRIKNYQVEVREQDGEIIFLHNVKPGRASHSYGVAVAEKAGVPKLVTNKALRLLHQLEHNHRDKSRQHPPSEIIKLHHQIRFLNINDITPMQALSILAELQKHLENEQD